jgi:hypothetical protein
MQIDNVQIVKDTVVIGAHPENADMGNPNGYEWGHRFFVIAEFPNGRRMKHPYLFKSEKDAGILAKKVQERGEITPKHWVEFYPVYGSSAWHKEETQRRHALEIANANNDQDLLERFS